MSILDFVNTDSLEKPKEEMIVPEQKGMITNVKLDEIINESVN